jgi:hypothetical protein
MQIIKFLFIDFLKKHLILYCEQRAQLLLTLVESFILNVKRIELRKDKSC